jgi:cation transport regulator ChaB
MPYETVRQLPATIREVLPEKAKERYLKAYNQTWVEYDKDAHRGLNQGDLAHQQAWMAVKQEYIFDLGEWRRKDEPVEKKESKGILGKVKSLFSR